MTRAQLRQAKRAQEKAQTKRMYTQEEFEKAVQEEARRRTQAHINYLDTRKVEELTPIVENHMQEEWTRRLDEATIKAWSLFINSSIFILWKNYGWDSDACGDFADLAAGIYNDGPELADMQDQIWEHLELKVGYK